MANALSVKFETSESPAAGDAAVVLINSWSEKGAPASAVYESEIAALASAGLISGKPASISVHLLPGKTASRLLVVGLGEREKATAETFRVAGGALAKWVRKHPVSNVVIHNVADPAAFASGLVLGGFDYTDYKGTVTREKAAPRSIRIVLAGKFAVEQREALSRAVTIADAQNYARTIASRPGNDINPPSLAKAAELLAREEGLDVQILDEKKMKQLGMGGILAVGSGSNSTPPRMIVLDYSPKGARGSRSATLLVVGKSITFDTGGISIKGAAGMQKMVFDKCGGMAVLGMMLAISRLKLPVRVVGILASAENHISETAYRPGDILKMYNGVTVEVTNTDAEGRLVLGDALSWGIETYKPAAVVDLATLTGGVVIALGKSMAGIMSNNDQIVDEITAASRLTGEKVWRLPIGDDQRDLLKSDPADIVNSGPREATPLQGGAFLSYFVPGNLPWVHIDIAGVADTEKELPYYSKGATGWGVRTLVEWVTARASKV